MTEENATASSTRRVRFAVADDDDEDDRVRATGPTAPRIRSRWRRQARRAAASARNSASSSSTASGSKMFATGSTYSNHTDPPSIYFMSEGGYRMEVAIRYPVLTLDAGTEHDITWIGPAWNDFYMSVPNVVQRGGTSLEAIDNRVHGLYSRSPFYAPSQNAIVSLDSLGLFKRGMPCAAFNRQHQKWRRAIVIDEEYRAVRYVDYGTFRNACEETDVKPISYDLANMSPPLYNPARVSAIQDVMIPLYHDFPYYVWERIVPAVVLNRCAPFEVMLKIIDRAKYASEKWTSYEIDDRPRARVVDVDTLCNAVGEFAGKCVPGCFERIDNDAGLIRLDRVQRRVKFHRDVTKFHGEPMDKVENLNRVFKLEQKIQFNMIKAMDNGDSIDDSTRFVITDIRTVINDEDKYITCPGIITYVGKSDVTVLVRCLGEYVWASKRAFPPTIAANYSDDLDELIELGTHVIVRAVKAEDFYDILVPVKWIAVAVEIQCDKIVESVPMFDVDVFKLDQVTEFPIFAEWHQTMENVDNSLQQSRAAEEEERIQEQMRIEEENKRQEEERKRIRAEEAERARANDPFMGMGEELDAYFRSPPSTSTASDTLADASTSRAQRRRRRRRGDGKLKSEAECQTDGTNTTTTENATEPNPSEQASQSTSVAGESPESWEPTAAAAASNAITADLIERAKIDLQQVRASRDESTVFNEFLQSMRESDKKVFEEEFAIWESPESGEEPSEVRTEETRGETERTNEGTAHTGVVNFRWARRILVICRGIFRACWIGLRRFFMS